MLGLHIIIAIIAALVLAKFIYSSDYLIGRYLQIESQFLINLNAETWQPPHKNVLRHGTACGLTNSFTPAPTNTAWLALDWLEHTPP